MTTMEEDVFVKENADELTQRNVNRLGERQQKSEQMARREHSQKATKLSPLYYLMAVAVCIAIVILVWPTNQQSPIDELGIGTPNMTEFRAASPEAARIEQLISEDKIEEALRLTANVLKNSDLAIEELGDIPELWEDEEEMAYEDHIERVKNSELRWTYIYLLVRAGKNKEARKELKRYLKDPLYCEHEQEARQLLEKIRK